LEQVQQDRVPFHKFDLLHRSVQRLGKFLIPIPSHIVVGRHAINNRNAGYEGLILGDAKFVSLSLWELFCAILWEIFCVVAPTRTAAVSAFAQISVRAAFGGATATRNVCDSGWTKATC
jgi:hypothetical protein